MSAEIWPSLQSWVQGRSLVACTSDLQHDTGTACYCQSLLRFLIYSLILVYSFQLDTVYTSSLEDGYCLKCRQRAAWTKAMLFTWVESQVNVPTVKMVWETFRPNFVIRKISSFAFGKSATSVRNLLLWRPKKKPQLFKRLLRRRLQRRRLQRRRCLAEL